MMPTKQNKELKIIYYQRSNTQDSNQQLIHAQRFNSHPPVVSSHYNIVNMVHFRNKIFICYGLSADFMHVGTLYFTNIDPNLLMS